ncbi:hypothetical protein [Streptacidiphilus anmyonensis]|uniref:hypothetical protein n=1 Tax=Streptacidiphilus anmyonensis TaxID=405782 RepID=UPI0005AA6189|nr:hypothetical protein [Streptacidiphilus anmyonensis]
MTTTAEITVEVVEHDPHDGDAVLAVLAEAFQATAEMSPTPMPMTAAPTSPSTAPATMCRARSFLTMPEAAAVLRSAPAHLNQPVDVDILGPADAVEQARTLLAGVFTVQDLGWVSGEHEFETRLRLT